MNFYSKFKIDRFLYYFPTDSYEYTNHEGNTLEANNRYIDLIRI
jgi:hypothetical protein